MSKASVVIPNWNGLSHLPECLEALASQTFKDFEIIVVDNASSDASVGWVKQQWPEVRVIERTSNGGFSAAVNDGIKASSGEYVALLNNDTVPDRDWLRELVLTLDASSHAIAASLMTFYDDPGVVNTAGDVYSIGRLYGVQRGRGQHVEDYQRSLRVLGASAGAALYRKSLFAQVGLFDEDFFLIHEDTDLNLRCLIAGMTCVFVPTSVVRHKDSATIREQPSPEIQRLFWRNQMIVVAKDIAWPLLPVAFVSLAWLIFRQTVPLRPWKWHEVPRNWEAMDEQRSAFRVGWSLGWSKRRVVWSHKANPLWSIVRWTLWGVGVD